MRGYLARSSRSEPRLTALEEKRAPRDVTPEEKIDLKRFLVLQSDLQRSAEIYGGLL